ncbi:alcohol dehydrogenase catalytic domain-containing protein [Acidipropionibacterium virtanenii]|uniref:Putative zinc-binding alcohol dehydrogenase n=1 Tax=Acidipropionibacterium virtanenii TaxID=2057246 RepID=A0A344UR23_9ACTN|nr:alcohol dehydrogenase catalytic domain-containing protein [Acidipropionibacterium virtanenii]AXE37721.1 putative zinc-binding alcohol dehydrogenase [Acidipropionibacterium virtanenii]
MRAVTWQGKRDVRTETVDDPGIVEAGDAVVRVTSTAICGSDLHLYELLTPFMLPGDILGHEGMGVVEQTGAEVTSVRAGDRVVVPFNVSCGHCRMCRAGLQSQCETTQVSAFGTGAALLGYSKLYGSLAGAQAQYVRVPHADYGLMRVGTDLPDERYLFLSDILPTAWQGVQYAGVTPGSSVAVLGLGPVGQLAARLAAHLGARVYGVDPVAERRAMAGRHGVTTFPDAEDARGPMRFDTDGRGPDAVIDAVGMEAHGSPGATALQRAIGVLPGEAQEKAMTTVGIDRVAALRAAVDLVSRGGTVSLSGVYAGMASPTPLMEMFDKQLTVRMGQCNVRRWTDDLMPLVEDPDDPIGLEDLVTHRLPLEQAPEAYRMFQHKDDGCVKVILDPAG